MGSDDLFRKRKPKTGRDFKRRSPKRAPYDKVLIVCEGSKTEPNYFNELRDYSTLETANVRVASSCGSDPMSVVRHGKNLYRDEKQKGHPYDRVYCVFDGDVARGKFEEALATIRNAMPSKTFFAITSVPCFEYWFLLHFTYTTAQFSAVGGVSAGDATEAELRRFWPGYSKGLKGTFLHLLEHLDRAAVHGQRALNEAERNGTDNPSTRVHELVAYLQNLKKTPT